MPLIEKEIDCYGAFHAAEIAYAFDNLATLDWPHTNADDLLAETMSSYWVDFAVTGDPNGDGLPNWPAYTAETEPYMDLGDPIQADQRLLQKEADFIEKVMDAQYGAPWASGRKSVATVVRKAVAQPAAVRPNGPVWGKSADESN